MGFNSQEILIDIMLEMWMLAYHGCSRTPIVAKLDKWFFSLSTEQPLSAQEGVTDAYSSDILIFYLLKVGCGRYRYRIFECMRAHLEYWPHLCQDSLSLMMPVRVRLVYFKTRSLDKSCAYRKIVSSPLITWILKNWLWHRGSCRYLFRNKYNLHLTRRARQRHDS